MSSLDELPSLHPSPTTPLHLQTYLDSRRPESTLYLPHRRSKKRLPSSSKLDHLHLLPSLELNLRPSFPLDHVGSHRHFLLSNPQARPRRSIQARLFSFLGRATKVFKGGESAPPSLPPPPDPSPSSSSDQPVSSRPSIVSLPQLYPTPKCFDPLRQCTQL